MSVFAFGMGGLPKDIALLLTRRTHLKAKTTVRPRVHTRNIDIGASGGRLFLHLIGTFGDFRRDPSVRNMNVGLKAAARQGGLGAGRHRKIEDKDGRRHAA